MVVIGIFHNQLTIILHPSTSLRMDNPRIFIGEEEGAEEAKKSIKVHTLLDSINSEPNIKKDIIN
jgi:hypothetical protein